MSANELIKSQKFKIAAIIVGVFLVALVSFALGAGVGFKKARFSYMWGKNYERNFSGSRMDKNKLGLAHEFFGRDFRNAHGISGTILSISDNNVIIKDRDNKENTVTVTNKTIIKNRRDTVKISDLNIDERVVALGTPGDNGTINADLIRVFEANTGR